MDDVSPAEGVSCAECGRSLESDEPAETEAWRYFPAGAEKPHPFCPECAKREFGPPAKRAASASGEPAFEPGERLGHVRPAVAEPHVIRLVVDRAG